LFQLNIFLFKLIGILVLYFFGMLALGNIAQEGAKEHGAVLVDRYNGELDRKFPAAFVQGSNFDHLVQYRPFARGQVMAKPIFVRFAVLMGYNGIG
jgi:hypothetical protein